MLCLYWLLIQQQFCRQTTKSKYKENNNNNKKNPLNYINLILVKTYCFVIFASTANSDCFPQTAPQTGLLVPSDAFLRSTLQIGVTVYEILIISFPTRIITFFLTDRLTPICQNTLWEPLTSRWKHTRHVLESVWSNWTGLILKQFYDRTFESHFL